jgi:oxygen-independent coproporphyrinogen-3 oxidase
MTRCGYCDFNTYALSSLPATELSERYLTALIKERDYYLDLYQPEITSVYFGGGTPTMLAVKQLQQVLEPLLQHFEPQTIGEQMKNDELVGDSASVRGSQIDLRSYLTSDICHLTSEKRITNHQSLITNNEVTVEANPETLDQSYVEQLKEIGFNRISLGMQSADEKVLQILERQHTPKKVEQAVEWAKKNGLEISLDLIYGTAGETMDSWKRTLETAIGYGVNHLSCYALTPEPDTPYYRKHTVDPDFQAEMYYLADQMLTEAGLRNYEISNWAKPGHASQHNLNYWKPGNWIGLGAGAHSAVDNMRWNNARAISIYCSQFTEDRRQPTEDSLQMTEYSLQMTEYSLQKTENIGYQGVSALGSATDIDSYLPSDICHLSSKKLITNRQSQINATIREQLNEQEIWNEKVMLNLRTAQGLLVPNHLLERLTPVQHLVTVTSTTAIPDHSQVQLTLQGRMLADVVIRTLIN